ncbi:MAG: hypothetical protein JWP57_4095, partial [Spirosoma sp.]|nr:hypothetical protein [Spirosoma sp.]
MIRPPASFDGPYRTALRKSARIYPYPLAQYLARLLP